MKTILILLACFASVSLQAFEYTVEILPQYTYGWGGISYQSINNHGDAIGEIQGAPTGVGLYRTVIARSGSTTEYSYPRGRYDPRSFD